MPVEPGGMSQCTGEESVHQGENRAVRAHLARHEVDRARVRQARPPREEAQIATVRGIDDRDVHRHGECVRRHAAGWRIDSGQQDVALGVGRQGRPARVRHGASSIDDAARAHGVEGNRRRRVDHHRVGSRVVGGNRVRLGGAHGGRVSKRSTLGWWNERNAQEGRASARGQRGQCAGDDRSQRVATVPAWTSPGKIHQRPRRQRVHDLDRSRRRGSQIADVHREDELL